MNEDQTTPPQQLSADRDHPWYDAHWVPRARVLVNGVERQQVVLADGPGRRAVVYRSPLTGYGHGVWQTEVLEGDVVIVPKEPSHG